MLRLTSIRCGAVHHRVSHHMYRRHRAPGDGEAAREQHSHHSLQRRHHAAAGRHRLCQVVAQHPHTQQGPGTGPNRERRLPTFGIKVFCTNFALFSQSRRICDEDTRTSPLTIVLTIGMHITVLETPAKRQLLLMLTLTTFMCKVHDHLRHLQQVHRRMHRIALQ